MRWAEAKYRSEGMVCKREDNLDLNVVDKRNERLKQVEKFSYLGSTTSDKGGCEKDVAERIRLAWGKWREMSGILYHKRMSMKLKAKIY